MKEFIGKPCKIHIKLNNKDLFYKVKKLTSIENNIICFEDQFSEKYCYSVQYLVEISDS